MWFISGLIERLYKPHNAKVEQSLMLLRYEFWNPITRVTVRHHEACQLTPNSYPEWRIFKFTPHNHYGFFFLHTLPSTITFRLEYVLFYQIYAEITIFFNQEMFDSVPVYDIEVKMFCRNRLQHDVKTSKLSSYNPPPHTKWQHFLVPSGMQETCFLWHDSYSIFSLFIIQL